MFVSACSSETIKAIILKRNLLDTSINSKLKTIFISFIVFCILYYIIYLKIGFHQDSFVSILLFCSIIPSISIIALLAINKNQANSPLPLLIVLTISLAITMAEPIIYFRNTFISPKDTIAREIEFIRSIKSQLPQEYAKIIYTINPQSPLATEVTNIFGVTSLGLKPYMEYLYSGIHHKKIDLVTFQTMMFDAFHPLSMISGRSMRITSSSSDNICESIKVYENCFRGNPMFRMLCPSFSIFPDRVIREHNPYPRFWFSKSYQVKPEGEILNILMNPNFDPEDKIILTKEPDIQYRNLIINPSQTKASITRFEPDFIEINLNNQSGWLTLSDTFYPGWVAYVDGKRRPIYKGNYIFRTIPVQQGDKTIIMRYETNAVKAGLKISAIMFIVSFLFLIILNLKTTSQYTLQE
jgi:hypothetical protein